MQELLSVIIPVYNCGAFLEICLNSVVSQTYKNLEILCINDGSTDNSCEIIEKFAKNDSRIKLISQENMGVSEARNKGIENAAGKYIAFVDGDDYLDPETYFEMTAQMEKDDSDSCVCAIEYLDKNGSFVRNIGGIKTKDEFIKNGNLIAGVSNRVFCKNVIDSYNLRFSKDVAIGEDLEFSFCYLSVSNKISFVDKPFYKYVKHSDGALSDKSKRVTIFVSFKNMFNFLESHFDGEKACKLKAQLSKLFELHAIDYAFAALPKKNRKKFGEKIECITKDLPLLPQTRKKLSRLLFFYAPPKGLGFLYYLSRKIIKFKVRHFLNK